MDKKILAAILLLCAVVILFSAFLPSPNNTSSAKPVNTQFLPWQIQSTPGGSIRVFGLTLGQSTLLQAQQLFRSPPELSLFISAGGEYEVEAYYDKVILGGFSAKMVMVLEPEQDTLDAMVQRGIRISNLGGQRKKIKLNPADEQKLMQETITSLTYLTRAKLDEEIIVKRFGEPGQRLRERDNNTSHWLYPKRGLDIALAGDGRAVLQYVEPQNFSQLLQPLLHNSGNTQQ